MGLLEELRTDSYVIPIKTQRAAADEIERLRLRLAAILTWTENWNCPWEGEDEWREDFRLAKNAVAGKPD